MRMKQDLEVKKKYILNSNRDYYIHIIQEDVETTGSAVHIIPEDVETTGSAVHIIPENVETTGSAGQILLLRKKKSEYDVKSDQ